MRTPNGARITSYNVCYTKLLRIGHAAIGRALGQLGAGGIQVGIQIRVVGNHVHVDRGVGLGGNAVVIGGGRVVGRLDIDAHGGVIAGTLGIADLVYEASYNFV